MSIVIPASQLRHTVITVRCENAPTAPQIECAFDDQAPPGLISHEDKGSSFTFSDRRPATFHRRVSHTEPPVEAPEVGSPRADLSIERGVDHRGHFVRMSFSPAPGMAALPERSNPPPRQGAPGTNFYPSMERQQTPRQPTPRIASPRQPTPHQSNSLIQSHSPALMPPAQITSCAQPSQNIDQNTLDFSSMDFSLPTDDELMNVLQSSLNGFDYSHNLDFLMNQMSEGAIPDFNAAQPFDNSSIPATPELTSSSSSSSTFSSPPTPFDFGLPNTSPAFSTLNGAGNSYNGMNPAPQIEAASPQFPIEAVKPVDPKLQPKFQVQSHPLPSQLESRLLPCPHPGCKRQFKNTSTLTGHLKTHAGKGARFPCSFPPCTEKFSRRHDQLRHEVYKHGKRCEWVCNKCNSFFSYERSLEKHVCTLDKSRRGSLPVQSIQQPTPPSTTAEGGGGGVGIKDTSMANASSST